MLFPNHTPTLYLSPSLSLSALLLPLPMWYPPSHFRPPARPALSLFGTPPYSFPDLYRRDYLPCPCPGHVCVILLSHSYMYVVPIVGR